MTFLKLYFRIGWKGNYWNIVWKVYSSQVLSHSWNENILSVNCWKYIKIIHNKFRPMSFAAVFIQKHFKLKLCLIQLYPEQQWTDIYVVDHWILSAYLFDNIGWLLNMSALDFNSKSKLKFVPRRDLLRIYVHAFIFVL